MRALQRRSWAMLNWGVIAIIWVMYPFGVRASIEHRNYRDIWLVAAALFVVTAVLRRIGTCKVMLLEKSLLVLNPIGAKEIPYSSIHQVVATAGGGLSIVTVDGEAVKPFAFGGSLLDAHFRTSDRAADEIRKQSRRFRTVSGLPTKSTFLRRCWTSDVALVGAVLAVVTGAVVGAL